MILKYKQQGWIDWIEEIMKKYPSLKYPGIDQRLLRRCFLIMWFIPEKHWKSCLPLALSPQCSSIILGEIRGKIVRLQLRKYGIRKEFVFIKKADDGDYYRVFRER